MSFNTDPIKFNKMNGLDFAFNMTVAELAAELKKLRTPTPGFGEGRIAAHMRAGGVARIEKIEMLTAYMKHHKLEVWNPSAVPAENAFTKAIKASIEREDKASKVEMPEVLTDLYMQHATSIARIDAFGDEMEAEIVSCISIEGRIRDEAYAAGAGSKDLRLQLDAASIRDTIAKRFRDGKGTSREGTSVAKRIDLWGLIFSRFKKAA